MGFARHFFSSEAARRWIVLDYPEIEELIKSREKHYSLVLYMLMWSIWSCDFKTRLNDFQTRLNDFQKRLNDFQTRLNDFKTRLNDFKTRLNDFKTRLNDFQTRLNDFKTRLNDFQTRLNDFKTRLNDFKTRLSFSISPFSSGRSHNNRLKVIFV